MYGKDKLKNAFIATPEFILHPIISRFISNENGKLIIPDSCWNSINSSSQRFRTIIGPFVEDVDSALFLKEDILKKVVLSGSIMQENISIVKDKSDYMMKRFGFKSKSNDYYVTKIVCDYLALSSVIHIPILMVESSQSRFMRVIHWLNDKLDLYHNAALVELFSGDEKFPKKAKAYGKRKLKSLGLIFTPEGRSVMLISPLVYLIGETILGKKGLIVDVGWFIFYDP